MRTGVSLSTFAAAPETTNVVEEAVTLAGQVAAAGVGTVWFGQMFSYDAVSLAGLVGRAVPSVQVGVSVVPIPARHPYLVASAAKTAQAATGGRFRLGIGLGAKTVAESVFGVGYPPPAEHLREYLTVLRPALDGHGEPFEGTTLTARPLLSLAVAGASPRIPVVVAAMGPRALRVAGALADGVLPFLAGPRVIAEHILPALAEGAADAGRPVPQVIAAIPAVVTGDPDGVRERAAEQMAFYDTVPSYQRVIGLEGAERAADLVVAGDEPTVRRAVERYRDAGAAEVTLTQTDLDGDAARRRTWALAGELHRPAR